MNHQFAQNQAAELKKSGQCAQQLNQLNGAIDVLLKQVADLEQTIRPVIKPLQVADLEQTIRPVIKPLPATPPQPPGNVPVEVIAPLADDIRSARRRLQEATDAIHQLISAVEL